MNVTKFDYMFQKFNQENVENLLRNLGLNVDNYFFALTKPSMLGRAFLGIAADFSSRYIVSFVFQKQT